MEKPVYFAGLDLGSLSDFSALVVVEKIKSLYSIRYINRWPIRTQYTTVVEDLLKMFRRPPLAGSTLCLDATGVGRPVTDMIANSRPDAKIIPITITAGKKSGRDRGEFQVPKKDLVGVLQVLLGTKRLKIAPSLPQAKLLLKELGTFKVKVSVSTAHESFESWREKDHDDLVLAAALPLWYAERGTNKGPLLKIMPFSAGLKKSKPIRIVACSHSELAELEIEDRALFVCLREPSEESTLPEHALRNLLDSTVLHFSDLDPGDFTGRWDEPIPPAEISPEHLVFTREIGKKFWAFITRKRDPWPEVYVISDNGDRRALSLAYALADIFHVARKDSIYYPRDLEMKFDGEAPNKHIFDVTRNSRGMVV